jgi:ribosomal-protein-alanine N-acetyltransferase
MSACVGPYDTFMECKTRHGHPKLRWSMDVEPVTLEGKRLRVEPLSERHAADLRRLADAELFTYIQQIAPSEWTEEGFKAYVRRLLALPGWYYFAMVLKESEGAVGVSSYSDVRPEHRGLEIGGTWIARPYQGTFVNPECKYLLLRHAFETLGAIRVQLKTDLRNVQSQRNIEKLGAKKEGVLRKHMLLPDGYQRDSVMYSITDEEWPDVGARLAERLGYVP